MMESIFTNGMTLFSFLTAVAVSAVLGILTAAVFFFKSRHSSNFALTLSLLPVVVTVVIMLVNGNVGTGVAVAGAFALVRFRSVPGTGSEIAAIFTVMGIGLAAGMGYLGVAVILFLFVAVITLAEGMISLERFRRHEKCIKVSVPENTEYENLFDDLFQEYQVSAKLEKIRTTNMGTLFEITYRAVFKGDKVPKELLDRMRMRNGNLPIMVEPYSESQML